MEIGTTAKKLQKGTEFLPKIWKYRTGDSMSRKIPDSNQKEMMDIDELLQNLINDYTANKQQMLINMRRGSISKEMFLQDAKKHVKMHYKVPEEQIQQLIDNFEQYIFGYSRLSYLIDDLDISDIRCVGFDNIRVKKLGKRMESGISFRSEKEYRQFVDFVATKNQVSISNLNAIQRFTDTDSHPNFILRFTISMPIVNTYSEPYLCIRKVPKHFPTIKDLIRKDMLDQDTAEILVSRFGEGSTLICGSNSSGKTTLLNALKETLPDDMSVLVAQQADELTTQQHPDMMFLHSLPGTAESQMNYDLKNISIAGLTMDVDFFIVGEVKGEEAMYLLNAAYTGQICAATVHAPDARKGIDKIVDYAMYSSRYSRNELMKMMDCFSTVIYMEHYKVKQVYQVDGWDETRKTLIYTAIKDYGEKEVEEKQQQTCMLQWSAVATKEYNEAIEILNEKQDSKALAVLYREAEQKNAVACDALGQMYEKGYLVEQNQEKAHEYYYMALTGYIECLMCPGYIGMTAYLNYRVGSMLLTGEGTAINPEAARTYLIKAANMGNSKAQKILEERGGIGEWWDTK
jgi:pilus assembly protein CpaF